MADIALLQRRRLLRRALPIQGMDTPVPGIRVRVTPGRMPRMLLSREAMHHLDILVRG